MRQVRGPPRRPPRRRHDLARHGSLPPMPPPIEGVRSTHEPQQRRRSRVPSGLDPRPRRAPGAPLPDVDERLVMPETRFEVIDGKVEHVPPADEAHGTRHSKISALLEAHVADGYEVASDMLTRTSVKGDMAPDASVFPAARDPKTGGRKLEEMAFEVCNTERLGHAAKKARALSARGGGHVGDPVERRHDRGSHARRAAAPPRARRGGEGRRRDGGRAPREEEPGARAGAARVRSAR